jgi:hypothetical protein
LVEPVNHNTGTHKENEICAVNYGWEIIKSSKLLCENESDDMLQKENQVKIAKNFNYLKAIVHSLSIIFNTFVKLSRLIKKQIYFCEIIGLSKNFIDGMYLLKYRDFAGCKFDDYFKIDTRKSNEEYTNETNCFDSGIH